MPTNGLRDLWRAHASAGFKEKLEHFTASGPSKSAAQHKRQQEELLQNVPEEARGQLDTKLLDIATSMNLVENIALLSQSRNNGFIGVNLYCDDEGSIKGLPRNLRATELAHCAGKPIEVKGDAFLARVYDNGDDFERLNFDVSEVSSDAQWVKDAAAQNALRREQDTSAAGLVSRMRATEAASKVRELSPAEAFKEDGNAAFKRGDWPAAIAAYSKALEASPCMLPALNNRALALLKLQQWQQAEADCSAVLQNEPHNVKALLRRATAREAMQQTGEAVADLEAALQIEPNNKEAVSKLRRLHPAPQQAAPATDGCPAAVDTKQ
ncbi:hypothetical protein N2152v2_002169 [Parachlorella kessleri]